MQRKLPNTQTKAEPRVRTTAPSLEFLQTSAEAASLPIAAIVWVGEVAYCKRARSGEWEEIPPEADIYKQAWQ
jgi:hypothetical protein